MTLALTKKSACKKKSEELPPVRSWAAIYFASVLNTVFLWVLKQKSTQDLLSPQSVQKSFVLTSKFQKIEKGLQYIF